MDSTFDWLDSSESVIMTNYRIFEPCSKCKRSVIINTTCECTKNNNNGNYNAIAFMTMFIISTITTMVMI